MNRILRNRRLTPLILALLILGAMASTASARARSADLIMGPESAAPVHLGN